MTTSECGITDGRAAHTAAIPTRLAEVDAGWLTECLRSAGAIERAVVVGFEATRIGEGRGFAGQLARLQLRYDRREPGAPQSLVFKLPSDHHKTLEMVGAIDGYAREVTFYRELAPHSGVSTPRCFFAHHDPRGGRFCLLLEDMAPACSVDFEQGLTPAQAERVLTELAALHARWWGRQVELPSLRFSDQAVHKVHASYLESFPRFRAAHAARHTNLCRAGEIVAELARGDELIASLHRAPQTLTHNDVHLDNVLFPGDAGGRFALIDWQVVSWSRHGASDVARLLGIGLKQEVRRAHGDDLLRHYHRELRARGVRGYRLGTLKQRVRAEQVSTLVVLVVAAMNLDLSGVDEQLLESMLGRADAAVGDARLMPSLRLLRALIRGKRAFERLVAPLRRSSADQSSKS